MRYIVVLIISLLTLLGCKTKEEIFLDKHEVIFCNTEEFDNFIKQAPIKPEEAKNLMLEYVTNNNLPPETSLYFIIDNNYTFTNYVHSKIPEAYSGKIWINANTGEVKVMNEGVFIRAYHSYKW